MDNTTACACFDLTQARPPFDETYFGQDEANGRFGDVCLQTCCACGQIWLDYHVEYEAFSQSGRWFRGSLTPEQAQTVTPKTAADLLASLP